MKILKSHGSLLLGHLYQESKTPPLLGCEKMPKVKEEREPPGKQWKYQYGGGAVAAIARGEQDRKRNLDIGLR